MSMDTLAALLGTDDLPGSETERAVLARRIEELARLNGEQWVIDHRRKLIREWAFIVERGIIQQPM